MRSRVFSVKVYFSRDRRPGWEKLYFSMTLHSRLLRVGKIYVFDVDQLVCHSQSINALRKT